MSYQRESNCKIYGAQQLSYIFGRFSFRSKTKVSRLWHLGTATHSPAFFDAGYYIHDVSYV